MPKARKTPADDKPETRQPATQFQPGQSGNPAGRPLGSRAKLGEAFLTAMEADFEQNGVAAIARVREERPQDYLKVIASILPKEIKVSGELDGLTDEQLELRIRQLAAALELSIEPSVH